jgi:uncharacterized membrane protein YjjP (DUF1212 family)
VRFVTFPPPPVDDAAAHTPTPLSREELTDVIDLTLTTGQFLLEHGATSMRVEETMALVSRAFGVDKLDVLVSPNVLIVTTEEASDFRTKARRIGRMHVHMSSLHEALQLVASLDAGKVTRREYRERIEAIAHLRPVFPEWPVALMVGLACAGFGTIVRHTTNPSLDNPLVHPQGLLDLLATMVGSTAAMRLRQWMIRRKVNVLMNVFVSAFMAFLISGVVAHVIHSPDREACVPAAVLFLVPGVPLLNAVDELFSGHLLIGLARAVQTLMIFLAIGVSVLTANWTLSLAGMP